MVMDALRNAKRFRATVSFYSDTGLKDAVETGEYRRLVIVSSVCRGIDVTNAQCTSTIN